MKTIVVGYGDSEAAGRALIRAADVAEVFSAGLVVVSVESSRPVTVPAPVLEPEGPLLVSTGVAGPVATGGTAPLPEPDLEPEELARRRLERARTALSGRKIEVEYVAEVGLPAERLLDVAEHRDADLIVVGSREHGLIERLLGRAVDQELARRSERDVLLVH
jgi:nucleotide-binding universal stress UspA family protein